jgi:hypothetical protein
MVTASPEVEGLGEVVKAVVVAEAVTICESAVEVLTLKFPEPR